jgi:hypothetical protein
MSSSIAALGFSAISKNRENVKYQLVTCSAEAFGSKIGSKTQLLLRIAVTLETNA